MTGHVDTVYDNLLENAYLHCSRVNVERILRSWADLKADKGDEHEMTRESFEHWFRPR